MNNALMSFCDLLVHKRNQNEHMKTLLGKIAQYYAIIN